MGNEAAKAAAQARKEARQARKLRGKSRRIGTSRKHANGTNGGKAGDPRVS